MKLKGGLDYCTNLRESIWVTLADYTWEISKAR